MHSHTSDLSLSLSLFVRGLANRVAATFFSLLTLSLSLSLPISSLLPFHLFLFSLFSFPSRLFSFFFFFSFKISRRSPNGGRDWPARKTRIKKRTAAESARGTEVENDEVGTLSRPLWVTHGVLNRRARKERERRLTYFERESNSARP